MQSCFLVCPTRISFCVQCNDSIQITFYHRRPLVNIAFIFWFYPFVHSSFLKWGCILIGHLADLSVALNSNTYPIICVCVCYSVWVSNDNAVSHNMIIHCTRITNLCMQMDANMLTMAQTINTIKALPTSFTLLNIDVATHNSVWSVEMVFSPKKW